MNWIKIEDEQPPIETEIIICTHDNYVTIGELAAYGEWRALSGLGVTECTMYLEFNKVSHWMPLPICPND